MHPALYVSLVTNITQPEHWKLIKQRFRNFASDSRIQCLSIPVESATREKDKAAQVNRWWTAIEQRSIELSLDYKFMAQTDITACYASIYTHSIAWALHSRAVAKNKKNCTEMTGYIVDNHIQDMRQGQTNGIPQGSVLMDLMAELVLGYADSMLMRKLSSGCVKDFQILRYRDDYRIFVNSSEVGESILKSLSDTMIDLGLRLNPTKTKFTGDVIASSIKPDKLQWNARKQGVRNIRKHLFLINGHSIDHPHSGSIAVALEKYYKAIAKKNKKKDELLESPIPLIGIVTDIAYRNPRVYPVCAAIISLLMEAIESKSEKREVMCRIIRKLSDLPNTGHLLIWLQRLSYTFDPAIQYDETLCKVLTHDSTDVEIWNNEWISARRLREAMEVSKVIDEKILDEMSPMIQLEEFELFTSDYYG